MSDISVGRTRSHMQLLWVNAPTAREALMHLSDCLRANDEVIDLHFSVDDNGRVTVGAYTEQVDL